MILIITSLLLEVEKSWLHQVTTVAKQSLIQLDDVLNYYQ